MIISYSTEDGTDHARQLADDLTIYGVKVYVDLPGYKSEFIGGPWLDNFTKLFPKQDFYILVVTRSFKESNAMKEFEKFKNCPNSCTGVCGKNNCNLKKIIPCFFIDPSTTSQLIRAIGGIREFYTESYEVGFMELLNQLFPKSKLASLEPKDIGEIIRFCKELEEWLRYINKNYRYSVEAFEEGASFNVYHFIDNIKIGRERVYNMYKNSSKFIKAWLKIELIRELDDLINKADEDLSKLPDSKLQNTEEMIKKLNNIIKEELSKRLMEVNTNV